MTVSIVLYGLNCSLCGEPDQLWQDLVRGLIECRACGARAFAADGDIDHEEFDGAEVAAEALAVWGFDGTEFDGAGLDFDGGESEVGGLLDR
ncbi:MULTISPECIES: hypothetical protein [Streptosporangium]|uniref:Zn ribbon nucleic-acid-binding protein n=1 Tax=Streptosporangium brasiliense TaxID=47480 RepID=A0ABT9R3V4_9ACTN|nr:hypothetical protein [Streptosporangium brasiliense]MDP9863921.1 Zn ribbon nucleic-acid-binding protein [Streptosporangium brasiliense]